MLVSSRRAAAVAIALVFAIISVSAASPAVPAAQQTCSSNQDCVPSACCGATDCINTLNQPNCQGVTCSQPCQAGTLDCSFGYCQCDSGRCKAYFNAVTATATPAAQSPAVPASLQTCSSNQDCVPSACCAATDCINTLNQPDCGNVTCSLPCQPGTLDCSYGYCQCDSGRCKAYLNSVTVLFTPAVQSPAVPAQLQTCSSNQDCVPSACCGATDCINTLHQPNCQGVTCSQPCQAGTLDCNQGYCQCDSGRCKAYLPTGPGATTSVIFAPATTIVVGNPPAPVVNPQTTCLQNSDCVPAACCGATTCVNTANAPDCTGTQTCASVNCACISGTCAVQGSGGAFGAAASPLRFASWFWATVGVATVAAVFVGGGFTA